MGNKHDMYIDYKRSNKMRGRRGKKNYWFILIIIIIIIGLGFASYSIIKAQIDSNKKEYTDPIDDENTSGDNTQYPSNDLTITVTPTVLPTSVPTLQPTQALSDETVSDNVLGEDTNNQVSVKGIYVPANTAGSDKINELIELTETTEINAMVIDVKDDHGKISYAMDCDLAKEIGAVTNTISDIETLVTKLKEKNIYLIARIVAFKDPYLAEKRQDLAIKNKDGTMYRDNNGECWVNPYNHEVWEYLVDIAAGAAAVGFNEIQFDYIRFSTGKGIASADFGETAKTKTKEEIIAEFTKYAYENIKPLGVYVSADVYGAIINSTIDAGLVGQNYAEMSKYLDYICPMIYPSHFGEGNYGIEYPDLEPYNIIHEVLTASETNMSVIPEEEHRAIVRPWLQDFTATWIKHHMNYGGPELRQQIEAVYSVGYGEWLLWNAVCDYSEDGLLAE